MNPSCFPLEHLSFLSYDDQEGDIVPPFPALPANSPFADSSVVACAKSSMQGQHQRRLSVKKNYSWTSLFKELFVSRTVFHFADDDNLLEDMTISWSTCDEDSDLSTVPGFDDWDDYYYDENVSEEDTFCVETILRRVPTSDSSDEEEESVLVSFSSLE